MSAIIANLTNHFLVAMPTMADPNFTRTLTYIAEHNDQGALGIIVNRPLELTLTTLFERVDLPLHADELATQPVYFGGPVQTDRGFVLHRPIGHWQSTLPISDEIGLTSSRDVLQALSENTDAPRDILISLGYAGWSAGQLEQELAANAWLIVPADVSILFDQPPEARFSAALAHLGIEPAQLSGISGHA
ncbi:MAG TPA: YqgE/AlgH family protein [Azoarcus sp.]|nr:YqgE/AlgH family protein [Azoarcus sp.]